MSQSHKGVPLDSNLVTWEAPLIHTELVVMFSASNDLVCYHAKYQVAITAFPAALNPGVMVNLNPSCNPG